MRKVTSAAAIAAIAAAISMFFAGSAQAALLSDLTALGYTVTAATQCENAAHVWVNVWYVSGYGIGTYLSECDPDLQANIDSIARGHCERKWQFTKPEQVDPWTAIGRLGWTTSADKCADVFTITNPNGGTIRYSGAGAALIGIAAIIGAPPVPTPPAPPAPVEPPSSPVAGGVPQPPAPTPPPAAPAPEPQPSAVVAVTPDPAPAVEQDAVATPPAGTITLTPAQLQAMIAKAVSKAVAKQRAKVTKTAARARPSRPSSSPLKSRVRRR